VTSSKPLAGMTAVVTGAGRGIGRGVALRLAQDGAAVAVHFHSSRAQAEELVRLITEGGGRAVALGADVRVHAQCVRLMDDVEKALGPVDILVCNAGIARGGPLAAGDAEGVQDTVATNLLGSMYCTMAVTPGMLRRKRGRIIVISSPVGSHGGLQGQCAYAASKAGLLGLMKTAANELAPRGDITVNAVSPGVIPTDLSALGLETMGDALKGNIPMGRFGRVEEVASAVAFLASSEASYINGHDLAVDGGYALKFISRRGRNHGGSNVQENS